MILRKIKYKSNSNGRKYLGRDQSGLFRAFDRARSRYDQERAATTVGRDPTSSEVIFDPPNFFGLK